MSRPRVTVITIFYNAKQFLAEAIRSVLVQSFNDWEYILVDDGSTDQSSEIAREYAYSYPEKIRYLEHAQHSNRGMSASRNLGISAAEGEYIAFIDADDVWLPSKLVEQIEILDSRPDVGIVCGRVLCWSSWAGGRDESVDTGFATDIILQPPEATLRLAPIGSQLSLWLSDIMIRTELVEKLGGFENQFTGLFEDQVFFSKVYLATPIYFSNITWTKYRLHKNSHVAVMNRTRESKDTHRSCLEWLESYLASASSRADPQVDVALRRALRAYRNPNVHFILALPSTLARIYRRLVTLCPGCH